MLSVIVPIYNAEKYLPRCIDSILSQSFAELELLLINDGSTDGSRQICEEYALKDMRVRVVNKENSGVSSTRNVGIALARGEWITFVDADDWIENDTYKKLYKQIELEKADICCYDFTMVYPNRKGYLYTPGVDCSKAEYLKKWLRFELTSLCVMVVRKEIFEEYSLRCPTQNYCEDFYLTTKLIYYSNKVTKVNYSGYNYNRLNENSLVNNLSEKAAEQELEIYESILNFFHEKNELEQYEEPVVWRILKCTQHLILNSAKHGIFMERFPSRYSKYIFTAPQHFANKKIKIMAWLLCHKMGTMVRIINSIRTILNR